MDTSPTARALASNTRFRYSATESKESICIKMLFLKNLYRVVVQKSVF